jgi:succinate dehydrogenase/fumarate reductase flavoprotein subunit
MSKKRDGLTRRQVLAGTGAAAATLGIASCSTSMKVDVSQWDHTTDILVVGGGAGGCSAAVTASDAGSEVILLEKAEFVGGTASKSAGVLWIPNNFVLNANGVHDNREDCVAYMARYSYPGRYNRDLPNLGLEADELALLEAFYDNASPAVESLRDSGTLRLGEWRGFALDKAAVDYLDQVPENKVPTGRPLGPLTADGAMGLGAELMAQFRTAVADRNIPVLLNHRATRLIMDGDGRVTGLEVDHGGETVKIQARKGVIFATGGYVHNADFRRRYQRAPLYGACAMPMSEGDFIAIAGAAGAQMGDLGSAWRTQVLLENCLVSSQLAAGVFYPPGDSMVQVNRYGHRALNEHRNYNDRTEAHGVYRESTAEFPNEIMFMIYDQRSAEAFAGAYPLPASPDGAQYVFSGDTLEALTTAIAARLNAIESGTGGVTLDDGFKDNLAATIERFNGFAEEGADQDYRRGASDYDNYWHEVFSPMAADSGHAPNPYPKRCMHPLADTGPYYAMMLVAGCLDTCGGPSINASAQVLDTSGRPIPGLFAAGNCVASPSREAYYGAGHTLGMAVTFGYVAANSAASEGGDPS